MKRSTFGKAMAGGLLRLLGALGGGVVALLALLILLFLFRGNYLSGGTAVLLALGAIAIFIPWGLVKPRWFSPYAIVPCCLFLSGDGPAEGTEMPARPACSIALLFVAIVALGLAALTVETAAFVVGVCATAAFCVVAPKISLDLESMGV